jgi:two-component system CheB/CheR fusion protein
MSNLAAPNRPLRIFVVENHEDTLVALTHYLISSGYAVCSAQTMEDALNILPTVQFDVLISDIGLPDGDGWELLRRARLKPRVYTIAMSGFGQKSDRAKSEAAGYRKHLIKPFEPDDLDTALAQAVASRDSRAATLRRSCTSA